jgi:uncharacterized membrane protein
MPNSGMNVKLLRTGETILLIVLFPLLFKCISVMTSFTGTRFSKTGFIISHSCFVSSSSSSSSSSIIESVAGLISLIFTVSLLEVVSERIGLLRFRACGETTFSTSVSCSLVELILKTLVFASRCCSIDFSLPSYKL